MRQEAIDAVKAVVPHEVWLQSSPFIEKLKQLFADRSASMNGVIQESRIDEFSRAQMLGYHSQFWRVMASIFIDSLFACGFHLNKALELYEGKLRRIAICELVVHCRFLLNLNIMEELGFNIDSFEKSRSRRSHAIMYHDVVRELQSGNDRDQIFDAIMPSAEGRRLHQFWKDNFSSLPALLGILAAIEVCVAEQELPILRDNIKEMIDINQGYYWVHGNKDVSDLAHDDEHAADLYFLMSCLVFRPEDQELAYARTAEFLELYERFTVSLLSKIKSQAAA